MGRKKKKKKKPKYRGLILTIPFVVSSCATYEMARKEVVPCVSDCIVQSGPKLVLSLWEDIKSITGWPFEKGEQILGVSQEAE